jgi:hypothetical protein
MSMWIRNRKFCGPNEASDTWKAGREARADSHPRKPPAELRPSLQLHWVYGFDYQSEVENTSNTVEARQKVAA